MAGGLAGITIAPVSARTLGIAAHPVTAFGDPGATPRVPSFWRGNFLPARALYVMRGATRNAIRLFSRTAGDRPRTPPRRRLRGSSTPSPTPDVPTGIPSSAADRDDHAPFAVPVELRRDHPGHAGRPPGEGLRLAEGVLPGVASSTNRTSWARPGPRASIVRRTFRARPSAGSVCGGAPPCRSARRRPRARFAARMPSKTTADGVGAGCLPHEVRIPCAPAHTPSWSIAAAAGTCPRRPAAPVRPARPVHRGELTDRRRLSRRR